MRTELKISMIAVSLLAAACGKQEMSTATGKTSTKPTPQPDLAQAPQSYQRMRFVSDVEQGKTKSVSPRPSAQHALVSNHVPSVAPSAVPDPVSAVAALHAAPQMSELQLAESNVAALAPATAPVHVMGPAATDDSYIDHSGEWRGESGGYSGPSVVIRGGLVGGARKCDPRSDTHTTAREIGRPDFSMPLMPHGVAGIHK